MIDRILNKLQTVFETLPKKTKSISVEELVCYMYYKYNYSLYSKRAETLFNCYICNMLQPEQTFKAKNVKTDTSDNELNRNPIIMENLELMPKLKDVNKYLMETDNIMPKNNSDENDKDDIELTDTIEDKTIVNTDEVRILLHYCKKFTYSKKLYVELKMSLLIR